MLLRHPSHNAGARVLPYSPLIYNDIKVRTFSVSMRTGARLINIIYNANMGTILFGIGIFVVVTGITTYLRKTETEEQRKIREAQGNKLPPWAVGLTLAILIIGLGMLGSFCGGGRPDPLM